LSEAAGTGAGCHAKPLGTGVGDSWEQSVATSSSQGGYLDRPSPSGLADVIEVVLDKGLVIDVYVRVSLAGIELLTIDARVVIASVDTYLRFAEATNRLDIQEHGTGLFELPGEMKEKGAKGIVKGAVEGVKEGVRS
jgi:gas vesicle structural protein